MDTDAKIEKLKNNLSQIKSAIVAYSGGVDSTLLLYYAHSQIRGKVLAITFVSPLIQKKEIENSIKTAKQIGVEQLLIRINELKNEDVIKNDKLRCYYCKKDLYGRLIEIAKIEGYSAVLDGSNSDDIKDYRPGMKAVRELEIRTPLLDAGLTKIQIRELLKEKGFEIWSSDSLACLASRIPYGIKIKKEILKKIDKSEDYLRELGFRNVRVRHFNTMAKIEVAPEFIDRLISFKSDIVKFFKNIGYCHVVLDLEGYRTGSLNDDLNKRGNKFE